MQITVHLNGYYDWEPLPPNAEKPSKADLESRKFKDTGNGGYLMKVSKKLPEGQATHTSIGLPEAQIHAIIIDEMTRGDHKPLTRMQAVARYLSRHVMPHHAHRNWMQEIEVSDDGQDAEGFKKLVDAHVEAGNIDEEDVPALTEAYAQSNTADEHVGNLHQHFGIKDHAAFKAKREAARSSDATKEVSK